jgi:hypothetical protein
MKTAVISLLFIISLNLPYGEAVAQTIWYVDRDATGSNNGTSWANAWKHFDNIDWASINAGDTIYVSGGADSTTYLPTSNNSGSQIIVGTQTGFISFATGNPVVLARAWHPNHDGEVVITGIHPHQQRIFSTYGYSNIKFYGLKFVDHRDSFRGLMVYIGGGEININSDSLITMENCSFIGSGWNYGLYLIGYKITIKDCLITQPPNENDAPQDLFGISSGRGGHTIDGNVLIFTANSTITEEHHDLIQFSNHGLSSDPRQTHIIANNLLVDQGVEGISFNNFIYNYGGLGDGDNEIRFLIYNNILVGRRVATSQGGIAVGRLNNTYPISLYILNNTIIVKGSGGTGSTPITTWSVDTLVVKNNLVIGDTSMNNMLNVSTIDRTNKWIDYNFYSRPGGISGNFALNDPLVRTWAQWQSEGLDLNSIIGNSYEVTFVNKYGTEKEDYYTTTGRGLGVDLSNEFPFLTTDILGNPRVGAWDMGALQYQGSPSINFNGKIYLQGPFNSNSMTTHLSQNSLLPSAQPYNTAPWNYSGNEVLGSGSNVVDWVLVELRSSSNPSQVVSRRAAVLRNDGMLLEPNGNPGVWFPNVQEGSYYIAVFHRNHLAVMSSAPVQLSSNSQLYDFTNAMSKAFGNNPMTDLGSGRFGMIAGDGNGNGGVTIADRVEVWQPQNGSVGYLNGDFNLDSGVSSHDINLFWNINNGKMTQVP